MSNRRVAVLVSGLVLIAVVAIAPPRSDGLVPSRWSPTPTSAFSTWPIDPLVRPIRVDPTATPAPAHAPRVSPRPPRRIPSTSSAAGVATFYAYHPGQAAAAKRLRDAIGPGWRGTVVRVCAGARCVQVVLTDFESSMIPGRLIDLDEADFATLAGPGCYQRGVLPVRVSW